MSTNSRSPVGVTSLVIDFLMLLLYMRERVLVASWNSSPRVWGVIMARPGVSSFAIASLLITYVLAGRVFLPGPFLVLPPLGLAPFTMVI